MLVSWALLNSKLACFSFRIYGFTSGHTTAAHSYQLAMQTWVTLNASLPLQVTSAKNLNLGLEQSSFFGGKVQFLAQLWIELTHRDVYFSSCSFLLPLMPKKQRINNATHKLRETTENVSTRRVLLKGSHCCSPLGRLVVFFYLFSLPSFLSCMQHYWVTIGMLNTTPVPTPGFHQLPHLWVDNVSLVGVRSTNYWCN